MIARGFKPVGWVACVGVAAIGCYMVSLRVAAERADLTGLERRIVQTRQQIRTLEAELGTRGRLQQLEQWNDEVLALAAPAAGQFVSHDARLAQYSTIPAAPLEGSDVQLAAAPAPAPAAPAAPPARHAVGSPQRAVAPAPALAQPLVQRASLTLPAASAPARAAPVPPRPRAAATETRPAPARAATTTTIRPRAAPVRTAAAPAPPRIAPTTAPLRAGPTRTATAAPRTAAPVRAQVRPPAAAPAARRPALVDERTLRDIGSASRAERRGGRRD